MKWFNQHKNLGMAGGVWAAVVLLLVAAVWPLYQSTNSLLSKIKTKTSEREALSTKVTLLSQLDTNVLAARVQTLDTAIPPRKDILLYLTAIDGLSGQLGLSFGGISLMPGDLTASEGKNTTVKTPVGLQTLDTDIRVSGNPDKVYAFLRTIEQVLPLMQIKNVKVSATSESLYQLSLTLGMLWAPPATADVKGPVSLFTDEEQKYFTQLSQYNTFTGIQSPGAVATFGKQDLFAPATSLP